MQRRVFLLLAVIVCVPAFAQAAITITAGNHILLANTAGQPINIMLTSTAGSIYSGTDMRTTIAAAGPVITHVFGDPAGVITPLAAYSGSVWANGSAGIGGSPDGTAPGDTGRRVIGAFATPGFSNSSASGIYATLTIDTTGVAPGVYAFSLSNHPNGATGVILTNEETFEPENIPDLVLVDGTLTIPQVPEPGSIVLGLFAVAGLATVAIRRRRRAA
jgi:PEP-CTERM motif